MENGTYKLARLYDAGGDMSKRWFIEFYVFDERTGCLKRRRFYDVNKLQTAKERKDWAKKEIRVINRELQAGRKLNPSDQKSKRRVAAKTVKAAFAEMLDIQSRKVAPKTATELRQAFGEFVAATKKRYVAELAHEDLQHYIDRLLARGLAPVTVNKRVGILRPALKQMHLRGWLLVPIYEGFSKLRTKESEANKVLTIEQVKKLKASAGELLRICIDLACVCMLRRNEIRLLTASDIDQENSRLFIRPSHAKNAKGRWVPCPPALATRALAAANGGFVTSGQAQPSGVNTLYLWFTDALAKSGLYKKGYTLHSLRHTGAVLAYKGGTDIKTIQRCLGHHSLAETDRYLRGLGAYGEGEVIFPDDF